MSPENPFSTRFVRPGALSYRPLSGHEAEDLVERFDKIGRCGQLVGPHGSGKSTLLAELIRLWEGNGERVVLVELHDGQRRLPIRLTRLHGSDSPTLLAVDGYEQLGRWARSSLRRFCRRYRIGLVVTSHQSMGIPDLVRCAPSLALVEELVVQLLHGDRGRIRADEIRRSFHQHEGNVREVLFEMYDLFEAGSC